MIHPFIRSRRGGLGAWPIAWLTALAAVNPAHAQGNALEYAVKATYLYKFAPYVEWPNAAAEFPGGAFSLCLIGNDPFGDLLDRAVSDQQVAGHQVVVRRFAAVAGNPGCTVMFIGGSDSQSVAATLVAVAKAPVLTVTDDGANPAAKGIINFIIADNHVRFEIDDEAAMADGLTISSKLLSLAVRVRGKR